MLKKILVFLIVISLVTISGLPAFGEGNYDIAFSLEKNEYTIDEYITGIGTVYSNGAPLPNALVTMVVENEDGKSILDVDQYTTDSNGEFSVSFRLIKSAEYGNYNIILKSNGVEKIDSFKLVKNQTPNDDDDTPSEPSKPKKDKEPVKENGFIIVDSKLESSFVIQVINEKGTEELLKYLSSDEFYLVSDIFEVTTTKNIDDSVTIRIKYDSSKVIDPQKLGIYYFNETTSEWEYIGGRVVEDGVIECVVDHFSKYAVMEYRKTFDDIANIPWAINEIEVLAARHIVKGVDSKHFAPNSNITRAQFAKLLVEGLDLKAENNVVSFSDVKVGAWYTEAVEIAASLGIVTGYNGSFEPNAEITREQMATMIIRALKYVDPDGSYTIGASNFTDQEQISTWAKEAVDIAAGKGLVNGIGDGMFAPQGKATRAQSAVIIYRMLDLLDRL